jgi:uncharacterized membrane protein
MADGRAETLDWIEAGRVAPGGTVPALRLAGALPDRAAWRSFILHLTLWLGTIALASAVIFFFAYNWADLGRFAKFGLVEAAFIMSVAIYLIADRDGLISKAALTLATLVTGALLALIGQTYQTGADTWQLFALWAVAVLPFVLIARFAPLWLVWLGLLHLAIFFYFEDSHDGEALLWTLFAVDAVALIAWEAAARRGVAWLQERWSPRLVAVAGGTVATILMLVAIFDSGWGRDDLGIAGYAAWMGAAYVWYRHIRPDLFVLAAGALSLIVVVTSWLSMHLIDAAAGGFLMIGISIILMSAGAAIWLRKLAREQAA